MGHTPDAGTAGDAGDLFDASSLDAQDAALGPHASVRVGDFALPLLLDVDVCFSTDPVGASAHWAGPMMQGTHRYLENGLTSPYFNVAVGTQSIRFVLFDSTDCTGTVSGIPDFALPTHLADGERSTVVWTGTSFDAGSRPLEIFQFDDIVVPADGGNSLRVLNFCQTHSPIDIYQLAGFGKTTPCTLMYDDIPYGSAGVAHSLPGDGGPTSSDDYAPLGKQNLYQLCFQTFGLTSHGASCSMNFGYDYSTNQELGSGAWTLFLQDGTGSNGPTFRLCRDDGTADPYCN